MEKEILNNRNIVSVSWGDHLVFGEADGRLSSSESLRRRMKSWKKELGSITIHWRQGRSLLESHFFAAKGFKNPIEREKVQWDDFELVTKIAHEEGLNANLYVSLFDEGWPLPPKKVREVSYHNSMHYDLFEEKRL